MSSYNELKYQINTILIAADRKSFTQPGVHKFSKNLCASPKFRCQKFQMKQVPYQGSTNIRHHSEFSPPGDGHPGFVGESLQAAERTGSYHESNYKHCHGAVCVRTCPAIHPFQVFNQITFLYEEDNQTLDPFFFFLQGSW